jgi:hypothetical protein
MAATGPKDRRKCTWLRTLTCLVVCTGVLSADPNLAARKKLSDVAMALTGGSPTDAMLPFDKSFSGYDKLSNYFVALTSVFDLASQVEVTDEQDAENEVKLTVQWTLTLTNPQTGESETRGKTENVKLVKKDGQWKIVDLSTLDLFDPQAKS